MKPRLVGITGPSEGKIFDIREDPFAIGRDASNQMRVRHSSVSRRHCAIIGNGEGLQLEDLGSRHGTFLNGQPVAKLPLDHGDFIKVGGSVFLFLIHAEPAPRVSEGSLSLEDRVLAAESTIQIPAGDTQLLRLRKLQTTPRTAKRIERHLQALLEISSAVHSLRSVEPLTRRVLELVAGVVPAERAALWMVDEGEGEFQAIHPADETIVLSRTTIEQAMDECQAVLYKDIQNTSSSDRAESLHAARVHSLICAPLLQPKGPLGVLYVDTRNAHKQFDNAHLELIAAIAAIAAIALGNARHLQWLEGENRRLRSARLEHDLIGTSRAIEKALGFMSRVAPTDSTVLIDGESGTGKELMAQAIHKNSARASRPFIAINCAALTKELLESELFGHEKGAFTGATQLKLGQFEAADGGTVFLDEVGEMPLELQAKLLRVLQERTVQRVGGTREIGIDIRVIAATNRDLEAAIQEKAFREDLFYRLNVLSVTMPPLHERRDDIPLLANHFAAHYSQQHHRSVTGISTEAMRSLAAYDWPGNVRELANAIERAVVLGQDEEIQLEYLPETVIECRPFATADPTAYHEAVNEAKRRVIRQALAAGGGSVAAAARRLELHRNYVHRLIRNLGIKSDAS